MMGSSCLTELSAVAPYAKGVFAYGAATFESSVTELPDYQRPPREDPPKPREFPPPPPREPPAEAFSTRS